jgi:hypothetical protein
LLLKASLSLVDAIVKVLNDFIKELKSRRILSVYWMALFPIAYISSFFLSGTNAPLCTSGANPLWWKILEDSWQAVLEYAAISGFQFGKDIVFTYGPLGYLFTSVSQGDLIWQRIVFAIFWSGLVAWTLTAVASRISGLPKYILIIWFLFFPFHGESQVFFVMAYACFILTEDIRQNKSAAVIFLTSFVLLSLIKFTFFMGAAAGIAICSAIHAVRRNIGTAIVMVIFPIVVFLAFWLAAGQQLAGLFPWLKGNMELTTGYNEAMALVPKRWVFRLCAAAGTLFFTALVLRAGSPRLTVRHAGFLLVIALYTFLAWKRGFVRADGHVFSFIGFLPLAFSLLFVGSAEKPFPGKFRSALTVLFFGVTILCTLAANKQETGTMQMRFINWPKHLSENASLILKSLTGQGSSCYAAAQPDFRRNRKPDLPVARSLMGSSVDVLSHGNGQHK